LSNQIVKTTAKNGNAASSAHQGGTKALRSSRQRKYSLQALVSKVTPQNRHPETDWGKPMGKEIW
jgi:antitoxin component of MazEF toxin-antitoxin module